MTRKTRRLFFIIGVAAFFVISYFVLLYAQGYRYDFATAKVVRTGAIYVKTNTSATVLLNGANAKGTSFLSNTASMDSLLPGTYTVTVQKSGYSTWQKKSTVTEGFVQDYGHVMILPLTGQDRADTITEISNLLYPPKPSATPSPSVTATPKPAKTSKPTPKATASPSPTPDITAPYYIQNNNLYVQSPDGTGPVRIASGVSSVIQSPDDNKIAWYVDNQLWVYWIRGTDYQPYHNPGDLIFLARFNNPVKVADWFRDSDHLVVDAPAASSSSAFRVIETDTRSGVNIINY